MGAVCSNQNGIVASVSVVPHSDEGVSIRLETETESDAFSPRYTKNLQLMNQSRNLFFTVQRYYEPTSINEIRSILRQAERCQLQVRMRSGEGHSSSPLTVTNDILINTKKMKQIIEVDQSHSRITVESGVTMERIVREAAKYELVVPFNIDLPKITIAGAIAGGTHGSHKNYGLYSQCVQRVEILKADGVLLSIDRDSPDWGAVETSLGLLGIIIRITLQLIPQFKVSVKHLKLKVSKALLNLHRIFNENHSARLCWFPFNDQLLLTMTNRVPKSTPTSCSPLDELCSHPRSAFGQLEGWTTDSRLKCSMVKSACKSAFELLSENEQVIQQSENVPASDNIDRWPATQTVSIVFPVNSNDFKYCKQAWTDAVDLIEEFAANDRYPVNLDMSMRVCRAGESFLQSSPNAIHIGSAGGASAEKLFTANIEITTIRQGEEWDEFVEKIFKRWLQIPNSRPSWTSEFQGQPEIYQRIRAALGGNLAHFLSVRNRFDPKGRFYTPFFEQLFEKPIASDQTVISNPSEDSEANPLASNCD